CAGMTNKLGLVSYERRLWSQTPSLIQDETDEWVVGAKNLSPSWARLGPGDPRRQDQNQGQAWFHTRRQKTHDIRQRA
ncbi:MAG: hypothetical protein ACQERT_14550, partial [Thermodesulfobacteriota bacterium]